MKPTLDRCIVTPKTRSREPEARDATQDVGSKSHSEQQERIWIEEAKRDPQAFQPIFQKYHDPIFNYALRRVCNVNLAQDLTANTFLKALNKIGEFKWQGISIAAWLYRIATNEINLNHRKFKRMVPLTCELTENLRDERTSDSAILEMEEHLQKNEQFRRACMALSKIKLKYQTVLSLRYFEEKSIKEIAVILGKSENTVKTHIRRGLIRLKEQL